MGTKRLIANTLAHGDNQIAIETYVNEMLRGEEIAEEFSDFDMIITLLRQKSFSWQLADSVGIYAAVPEEECWSKAKH